MAVLHVLKSTRFHQSIRVIHISNAQYFIRSNNCILNFTTVSYSLHKYSETINNSMLKMTIYRSRITCFLFFLLGPISQGAIYMVPDQLLKNGDGV